MNIKQMAREWTKSNTGWIGDDGLELCEANDCMKAYTAGAQAILDAARGMASDLSKDHIKYIVYMSDIEALFEEEGKK